MLLSRDSRPPARLGLAVIFAILLGILPARWAAAGPDPVVTAQTLADRIRVEIDGALFTEYIWTDTPRPYLYPVIGPGGVPMTRNYPMQSPPGEEHDHPHHRSLWFGHGEVNDEDFWTEAAGAGAIVQDRIDDVRAEGNTAVIRVHNRWIADGGEVVCAEFRKITLRAFADDTRTIDFQITLHASEGPVHLGDTKEGAMAIRTHPNLRLAPANVGDPEEVFGSAVNSEGLTGEDFDGEPMWGEPARWVDYWGPIEGQQVGIAIFDLPSNPGYPTYWMARGYGLVAACPTGVRTFDFTKPPNAGARNIPEGGYLDFKYRFLFHHGDVDEGLVSQRFNEFVAEQVSTTAASEWLNYGPPPAADRPAR
jgi:hypothetical protein